MFFMMSLNMRVKSVLLACSMVVSSNSFVVAESNVASGVTQGVITYLSDNKAISMAMFLLVAVKIRLMTRSRAEYSYSYDEFKQEVEAIFSSFNILNEETRAKII